MKLCLKVTLKIQNNTYFEIKKYQDDNYNETY